MLGIAGGLLAAGLIFLLTRPVRGTPVTLTPPPTPRPIVVHVAGAVAHPGLYSLPPGSRWSDAIEAAGGYQPGANPTALNLAAILQDGERVFVPAISLQPAVPAPTSPAPIVVPQESRSSAISPSVSGLIDINTASLEELDTLPGIGPVTAQNIIAYRTEHGPFASIEAIDNVPGIGPATVEKLKDLITISSPP
jgi:competence protein ComEA